MDRITIILIVLAVCTTASLGLAAYVMYTQLTMPDWATASTAAAARTSLGLTAMSTATVPLAVDQGGTGAATAEDARSALGAASTDDVTTTTNSNGGMFKGRVLITESVTLDKDTHADRFLVVDGLDVIVTLPAANTDGDTYFIYYMPTATGSVSGQAGANLEGWAMNEAGTDAAETSGSIAVVMGSNSSLCVVFHNDLWRMVSMNKIHQGGGGI